MLEKSIAGNLAKFKTNFFQFLSTENDKKFFLKIYDLVEICLKMQEKDRLDFISMFQTILFSDKAKMKYLLFVQENSLQDLESMNWTIEPNNENIITVLPKFQENIVEKIAIKEKRYSCWIHLMQYTHVYTNFYLISCPSYPHVLMFIIHMS